MVHETGVGVELRRLAKVRWHVGQARGEPTVGRCRKIRAHVRGMHYWRPHKSNIGRTQGGIIVQGTGIASVAARLIGRFTVARLNAVLLHRDRAIDLGNKKTEDWRLPCDLKTSNSPKALKIYSLLCIAVAYNDYLRKNIAVIIFGDSLGTPSIELLNEQVLATTIPKKIQFSFE